MAVSQGNRFGPIQSAPESLGGLRYEVLRLDATLVLIEDKALAAIPEGPGGRLV